MDSVTGILLNLDAIIYNFINFFFKIFLALSRATIFTDSTITPLIRRIYMVIGVVMLFILSYSLLKQIVTPESKDKEAPGKIIFNVVKCIVILALIPTIFSFAFKVQNAILNQNTIGKIILGTEENCEGANCGGNALLINSGGMEMASGVFEAFLHPAEGRSEESVIIKDDLTYRQHMDNIKTSENFFHLENLVASIENGDLTYYWGISSVAGILVLYMLLSYCLSLGFRVIKLAFYEIMAPICVIGSILPSKAEMLSKWIKATLQTFVEVFLRVGILYFAIYLIQAVNNAFSDGLIKNISGSVGEPLAKAIIIMGIVTFVKQAPELIAEITGMDSKNMGLGLKDQLAAGGFFTAGAVVGGAATALTRNFMGHAGVPIGQMFSGAYKRGKAAKAAGYGFKDVLKQSFGKGSGFKTSAVSAFKGLGTGLFSGLAGGLSGGFRSIGKGSTDFASMKESAHKGAVDATTAATTRANYRAKYGNGGGFWSTNGRVLGGHIAEKFGEAGRWMGFGNIELLKQENDAMAEITSAKDDFMDSIEDFIYKRTKKGDTTIDLSGFGMGEASLTAWIEAKNALEHAKAGGDVDIISAEKAYKEATKAVSAEISKAMLTKNEVWDALDNDTKAFFSELKVKGLAFKGAIRNNASIQAVVDAGITGSELADNKDFVIDDRIDKMEKLIKVIKGNNDVSIMAAKQNEDDSKK